MNAVSRVAIAVSVALSAPAIAAPTAPELPQTAEAIERLQITGERQSGYLVNDQDSASKLPLSIKDTPQTVSVISAEKLKDFALNDINSAVEYSATVNVEQVETDRTYFSSRGFELTNIQTDGLGLNHDYGTTTGRVDAALYERIEIVHGANGVMTGVGSPAATVNLIRKKPTSASQASISTMLGSWQAKRVEADVSGALTDSWRARAVLVADDRESYLDRYATNSQVAYLVMDYAPTTSTLITFGYSEHRNDSDGNLWGALTLYYGDGTPTNFARETNISANWSYWNVTKKQSFIDLESQLSDRWKLRAAYQRTRTDEDSQLFYTYLPDPATGLDPQTGLGLVGYASEYDYDDKQDNFDLYLSGNFNAFGGDHEVVFGVSHARLDFIDSSLYDFTTGNGFPAMPSLEDWDGNTPLPSFTDGLAGSDINTEQQAFYSQARFSLGADTKLLVGGRWNEFTAEGIGYGVDRFRDEQKFIPYFGVTHALSDATTVYASYTETFKAQNLRDRNFELLPALTGESAEIGLKTALLGDKALLSMAYFDITQRNLAVSDGTVMNPNTNAPEVVYRAADGVSSSGFEIELSGELLAGLQGSIAATSFDVDGDALVENYTPENLFRSSLTYQFEQLAALKVGASFLWQDSTSRLQGLVGPSYANAGQPIITEQGAYGRLNLMASYQFSEQLMLTLNANNVFDKTYLNSLLWAQGYYGAPRNFSASLRYQF